MSEGLASRVIVERAQRSVVEVFGWVGDFERRDLRDRGGVGAMVGQGPPYGHVRQGGAGGFA